MSFKLYRYMNENLLRLVAFFPDEQELKDFFNNSYEVEQRTGIKIVEPNFKTLDEIKAFVTLHNSIIELKEYEEKE